MRRKMPRALRAQVRDLQVLFREFRVSLLLFFGIVIGGTLVFHYFYTYPGTDVHPDFGDALHATFAMIFFETLLDFPEEWYLRVLFFVIPVMGLAVVADGVIRFGAALVDKQSRGQKWQVAMASTYSDHVIVCGMGKVGYRVTMELLKFGRDVVAIEMDECCRFVEDARGMGVPVIISAANRPETLLKAGLEKADAIIPCTNDDLANLDIALHAREVRPDIKVVMRMFEADLAGRVAKGFGIYTAFSTSALAAPSFAAAAMRFNIKHSFYVKDKLLNLSELVVEPGARLVGWTVGKLEAEMDISVVLYQNDGISDLHPPDDLHLGVGDKVLVLASLEQLEQLAALNHPES